MAFQSALTTEQYITLRGSGAQAPSYQSGVFASLCPNTIIFQALVNQTSFTASFAQITFDTVTIGAYTAILAGMTVLVSPTTDLTSVVFTGRARADNSGTVATSTVLNINETSAAVANNYVITILDDYREWDKLGRQVSSIQYVDYAITFRQLLPVVYGLKSAYADWVSSSVLTISFTPSAFAATSGASISSWLWDVGDGTITIGSATTQNITATFPPGHRWIRLTVTDSGGRAITRKVSIHAHDPDLYPPIPLQAGAIHVAGDVATGFEGDITAWAGVADVLDNTLIVIWNDELYQDSTTSLLGDNIAFVGRFRQSTDTSTADPVVAQIAETRYTLESPMKALSRLEMLPYEFLNKTSPTAFFQIKNCTVWRCVCLLLSEFSTFLELHDLTFDDTSDTYLTIGLRTQGNNILAATNDLYYSVNGALQMNAAGQAQCVRDLRMVSDSLRNAAVTVANWTTSDILAIEGFDHPDVHTVGRLISTGGSFITANNQNRTFESLAPGVAQDYPEGSASLDRQVLTANASQANAQTELNQRAGNAFARAQETDRITINHPDGYAWLTPALDAWYTFTLDGSETVRGIVLTTADRWLLTSVDISHDGVTGQKEVHATYTRETEGAAGQTVIYPPAAETPYTSPTFPPFDLFPAFPIDPSLFLPPDTVVTPFIGNPDINQTTPPLTGDSVVILDGDNSTIYLSKNFISGATNPDWGDITPTTALDTVSHVRLESVNGLYAVSQSGTVTARHHHTLDAFAVPPAWNDTDLSGAAYNLIRSGSAAGKVMLLGGVSGGAGSGTDGWTVIFGTEVSRTSSEIVADAAFDPTFGYVVIIQSSDDNQCAEWSYSVVSGTPPSITSYVPCGNPRPAPFAPGFTSPYAGQCANSVYYAASGAVRLQLTFDLDCGTVEPNLSETVVAYSTDYGTTFNTQTILPAMTRPGFDVQPIGNVSIVGAGTMTKRAVSFGGGYDLPYGDLPGSATPNAVFIPARQFGGTVANDGVNPHYLVASETASIGGSQTLWKVTSSGSLVTNITPYYQPGTIPGAATGRDCLYMPWQSGAIIAGVFDFNGTRRVAVTVNTGASWRFTDALDATANAIHGRKGDFQMKQAMITNGIQAAYTPNYQASTITFYDRNQPGGNLIAIQVYG